MPVSYTTIGLLLLSNIFMTFAWYGHLKFKSTALDFPRNSILRVLFAKSEPEKCSFTLSKLRFLRT